MHLEHEKTQLANDNEHLHDDNAALQDEVFELKVRQLRPSSFRGGRGGDSRICRAMWYRLLGCRVLTVYRMLIGTYDPMLCPLPLDSRLRP